MKKSAKQRKAILAGILCTFLIFSAAPTMVLAEETAPDTTITAPAGETTTTEPTVAAPEPNTTTPEETTTPEANPTKEPTLPVDNAEEAAGVTPDSLIYPLEKVIESVQVLLTFSEDGKAELLIQLANERLAEAQIMTEKDLTDLSQKVMKTYAETIQQANVHVQNLITEEAPVVQEDQSGIETVASADTENTAEQEKINSLIEKLEVVQADGDQLAIKITASLTEEQAQQLQQILQAEAQNTVAMKAQRVAQQAYVQSVKEVAQARQEYNSVKNSGDEAAIQAAQEQLEAAEQNKDDMKDLTKDVLELKKEVKEENKAILKDIVQSQDQVNEKERKQGVDSPLQQGKPEDAKASMAKPETVKAESEKAELEKPELKKAETKANGKAPEVSQGSQRTQESKGSQGKGKDRE